MASMNGKTIAKQYTVLYTVSLEKYAQKDARIGFTNYVITNLARTRAELLAVHEFSFASNELIFVNVSSRFSFLNIQDLPSRLSA